MIRSILFPVLAGVASDAALATASDLARDHDAHLVVVNCISAVVPIAAWDTYPLAVYDTLSEAAAASGSRLVRELTAKLEQAGVSHEIRTADTIWMTPSEMAAVHAAAEDINAAIADGYVKFYKCTEQPGIGVPFMLMPTPSRTRIRGSTASSLVRARTTRRSRGCA